MSNISNKTVGRGTPEPIRSGTSRKTSNGNDGRTENPPVLAVGSANLLLWFVNVREIILS